MPCPSLCSLLEEGHVWFAERDKYSQNSYSHTSHSQTSLAIEASSAPINIEATSPSSAAFGIAAIDRQLAQHGLSFGDLHEWSLSFGTEPLSQFLPPTSILSILIRNACSALVTQALSITPNTTEKFSFEKFLLWIGRECWPSPFVLQHTTTLSLSKPTQIEIDLLPKCLFIDPPNEKQLLWCIDMALRSPSVAVVTAFPKRLSLAKSRRFAIAAKKNNTLGFLIRSEKDIRRASAAASKWLATPATSPSDASCCNASNAPCWNLKLLKQKGRQATQSSWCIELQEDWSGFRFLQAPLQTVSSQQDQQKISA